jgi:hypothetical protein
VPDHHARAARYRLHAEECRRLAALTSAEIGTDYESIARYYDELAQAELTSAAKPPPKAA